MYDRWVDNNAKKVTELSKGKLGYIHIPSMDEEGLDAFCGRFTPTISTRKPSCWTCATTAAA